MHERHLMQDLMQKMLSVATEHQAARITGIRVWLGALSHMSPQHFREHFDDIARGTIAEHASIECTVDEDPHHPQATGVLLQDIETEG